MSIRESIAENLVTTLGNVSEIKLVTRQPFDFDRIAVSQFPAALITTGVETRNDITIGGSEINREATITYIIEGYSKSTNLDSARNQMAELIEEALDVDRTRGGYALDTQVVSVEVDDGSIQPYSAVRVSVEVMYTFTRGTT